MIYNYINIKYIGCNVCYYICIMLLYFDVGYEGDYLNDVL